jgi:AraC family transcriptional regulator
MTPEEYQKSPRPLSHFLLPQLSLQYRIIDESVPLLADGIVLEVRKTTMHSQRFFTGLKIQNLIADTPGIDFLSELWTRLHQQKRGIQHMVPQGNEAGVSLPGETKGYFTYFAGAEAGTDSIQDGFTAWIMPEGQYAVCSFDAENFYLLTTDALNKARDYMLGTWLPQHKLAIEPFMVELYSDTSPEATSMEIWLQTMPEGR